MGKGPLQCRQFWFAGHVQGVGFRYNSHRIAQRYEVTGYVQNLPDGRVEMVLEGDKGQVEACLDEVFAKLGPFIRDIREDSKPANGRFVEFEIRY